MPIILDTDIGSDIDDAMALLLCLRHSTADLRAVTTVYGQVELRAKIAARLLRLAALEVPVAVGVGSPISSPMAVWHTGTEGRGVLDDADFIAPTRDYGILPDAIQLLTETVREYPGEIDIVAIGPLTNIARAIQADRKFAASVRRIWAMMGGISFPAPAPNRPLMLGEWFVASSSHNLRCDIGAARVVLASGIPIVMVGNDVTTRVRIDLDGISRIENSADAVAMAIMRMMHVWLDYRSVVIRRQVTWTCLHDALVVAEACGRDFTTRDPVDVEVYEDGSTRVSRNDHSSITICRTVRKEHFERWYLDAVARSSSK